MPRVWTWAVPLVGAVSRCRAAPAEAQTDRPAEAETDRASEADERVRVTGALRCPTLANPGGFPMECVGRPFDFGETLSRDWAGFRHELHRLGLTPTASYTAQFMGNPSGGESTGVTYAG